MPDSQVIDKHYRRLGSSYNEFLYYSPEFVRHLTQKMVEELRLCQDDTLVDLGCGTGMYAIDLLRQVPLSNSVLGVDPFEDMLNEIPGDAWIEPLCQDALAFSEADRQYDKVLIKETIHHIEERSQLFRNLHRRLSPGGVLLLVHVPPEIDYPLFDAAIERCLTWHADPAELMGQLRDAGFSVRRDQLQYRHEIPKERYFDMVRGCYMSVLTSFDDGELAAGLTEMERRYADHDVLRYIDRFDYLTATKS